jgi:hypothetical protein
MTHEVLRGLASQREAELTARARHHHVVADPMEPAPARHTPTRSGRMTARLVALVSRA